MRRLTAVLLFLLFNFFAKAQFTVQPVLHSFDVLNYTLNLDLYNCYTKPYPNNYNATDAITFVADSSLNSIQLNAISKALVIDSVQGNIASFKQLNDTLTIHFKSSYKINDTVAVTIFYHHLNVGDNNSFNATGGYTFTDCEPEGARNWFPCWDHPADKATTDITAKVPSGVLLGSNGSLEDSIKTKDSVWYHWKSRDPMATYLVVLASKINYDVDVLYWHPNTHPQDSIPIRFYHVSGETTLPNLENKIRDMLTYQSSLFGDYPFEKVGLASANGNFYSQGMEDQTMIMLCNNCWQEWLVFHELTHHWFGDLISPKSWADIFMNEGFAAYGEALWSEQSQGYAASRDTLEENATYYFKHNKGFPISMPSWAIHTPPFDTLFNGAITYNKAADVMDQLRYVLGDTMFFNMLKAFATNPTFMYKNTSIADFNNFINYYTGQNYNWFFNEWIFSPNHPVYNNTSSITKSGNAWNVSFTAAQTQTNTVFFQMPIQLQINFQGGKDSVITVMNNTNNQTFQFTFSQKPTKVVFDPDDRILLKQTANSSLDELAADVSTIPFSIYPNPAKNNFTVEFSLTNPAQVKMILINEEGKNVKMLIDANQPKGRQQLHFSNTGLANGIYFLKVLTDKNIVVKKLVIE